MGGSLWRMPDGEPPPPRWRFPTLDDIEAERRAGADFHHEHKDGAAGATGDGGADEEPDGAGAHDLVGIGADLAPDTLVAAYRSGLFPMPVRLRGRRPELGWWSPDPRAIIPLDGLVVTRSLRRSCRRFEIRVDTAFTAVMDGCADPRRPHGWIDASVRRAYAELHRLGWAHSVEAWTPEGELAGGLYGVAVGGFFAGESMFHHQADASKVALVGLVERLRAWQYRLLDVQWITPHLASLGAVTVPRSMYLRLLADAVRVRPTLGE